jgi:ribosomal protein S4
MAKIRYRFKFLGTYGDIWGEIFRLPSQGALHVQRLDIIGKRAANNARYFRFSPYVGKFGSVRRKKTNYGRAFMEKQKLRFYYNYPTEKLFRAIFKKARTNAKDLALNYTHLLEQRLDAVVLSSNLVFNIRQARKFVEAGLVKVNDRVITKHTFRVPAYSLITFTRKEILQKLLLYFLQKGFRLFPPSSHFYFHYESLTLIYSYPKAQAQYFFDMNPNRLWIVYH